MATLVLHKGKKVWIETDKVSLSGRVSLLSDTSVGISDTLILLSDIRAISIRRNIKFVLIGAAVPVFAVGFLWGLYGKINLLQGLATVSTIGEPGSVSAILIAGGLVDTMIGRKIMQTACLPLLINKRKVSLNEWDCQTKILRELVF